MPKNNNKCQFKMDILTAYQQFLINKYQENLQIYILDLKKGVNKTQLKYIKETKAKLRDFFLILKYPLESYMNAAFYYHKNAKEVANLITVQDLRNL